MRTVLVSAFLASACATSQAPEATLPEEAPPAEQTPPVAEATGPQPLEQVERPADVTTAQPPTQLPTTVKPVAKTPPPCDGVSGALARAVEGDPTGLELDDQGRVHVSMSFGGEPPALPEGCESELTAMGHIQAWCLPSALCALAAVDSISNVRPVRRADPKLD